MFLGKSSLQNGCAWGTSYLEKKVPEKKHPENHSMTVIAGG